MWVMTKSTHIAILSVLLSTTTAFAQGTETVPAEKPTPISAEAPATQEESAEPGKTEWPRSLWGVYGGLGIPHVLSGGIEYLDQSQTWSVAVEIGGGGYKPKDEENDKEEFSIGNLEVAGRYHPTAGSFYLAAALGSQGVSAKKTLTVGAEKAEPEVKISSTYVTPKVGWFWQFNSGLNFGVELGAQIPLSNKTEIEDGTTNTTVLNDPEYIKARQDAEDLADKAGKMVLPHAMVRLGYAF